MRRLSRYVAKKTGAAVVLIDHLPKFRDNQARGGIGGQHKLSGLDGVSYKFTLVRLLSRADSDPVDGLVLEKSEQAMSRWPRPTLGSHMARVPTPTVCGPTTSLPSRR